MNLPNKITFTRVIIIVVMIVSLFVLEIIGSINADFRIGNIADTTINPVNLGVAILFIIAASTDWLDGYLARKNNQVTDLGKFMDPLADKLLVNSILIFLCANQSYVDGANQYTIPVFLVIIMLVRDFAVDGLRLVAVTRKKIIAANIFGKAKTVAQMVVIPLLLLGGWPFSLIPDYSTWNQYLRIETILLIATTILSVIAGVVYFIQNKHVFKEDKPNEAKEV